MRTFLAFSIIVCFSGGLYLLQAEEFVWYGRGGSADSIVLQSPATQFLGIGLLLLAGSGWLATQRLWRHALYKIPQKWQWLYFVLIAAAVVMIQMSFIWQIMR